MTNFFRLYKVTQVRSLRLAIQNLGRVAFPTNVHVRAYVNPHMRLRASLGRDTKNVFFDVDCFMSTIRPVIMSFIHRHGIGTFVLLSKPRPEPSPSLR